jgi:hypothetical protein
MSDIGYSSTGDDPSVASMMGGADTPITSARIGIASDSREISKLKNEFASLRTELEKVYKVMQAIATASQKISGPGGQGGTGKNGAIGSTPMAGGTFTPAIPGTQSGVPQINLTGGAYGGAGRAGAAIGVAGTAANLVNIGFGMIDDRANRGYAHALSADRMSLVYQQMYGMTQNQVSAQYRTPMAQFRLGAGGVNALMGMQVSTGISAMNQAPSIEALRAITGYSVSTDQLASMVSQMADPAVVNRMFMMTGTSLIGPGGQQRTTMQVFQDLTRRAGLTNERLVQTALTPGSITRANLTQMGVTGEMQDMVLQYAMQNIQYQKAGGTGMYDPSRSADRKLMGIEDNFASQREETDRLRVARDEQFYRRQADNYADLEKQTQRVTRAMAGLEDTLSGIIGQGISTTGSRKIAGAAGTIIGGAIGTFINPGVGTIVGATIGGAIGQLAGNFIGDGADSGEPNVPYGYGDSYRTISLSELSNKPSFSNLHPTMRDRLTRMFRDNPNVGFGNGHRSTADQKAEFLRRHKVSDKKTSIYWDGKYWERTSGAPFAPPGRSMHEIGLAADLIGDLDWVQANAHKYGLKTFGDVNNEPWHVQPAELPNSRVDYEKAGAPWGTSGQGLGASDIQMEEGASEHFSRLGFDRGATDLDSSSSASSGLLGQMSISQKMQATRAFVMSSGASNVSQGTRYRSITKQGAGSRVTSGSGTDSAGFASGASLTGQQVAQLLYDAGFRGEDLIKGVAIAQRESNWRSGAHNPDTTTGDNSYGLFQINMLGKMGEERMKWFGISSYDALYDPVTNVRAMKLMFDAKAKAKGNGWWDWGPYKGVPETYNTDMAAAANIVNAMNFSGDPMFGSAPPTASNNVSVSGGHTFNISPNITISGSTGGEDLRRVAQEVARLIEREIKFNSLRSA